MSVNKGINVRIYCPEYLFNQKQLKYLLRFESINSVPNYDSLPRSFIKAELITVGTIFEFFLQDKFKLEN